MMKRYTSLFVILFLQCAISEALHVTFLGQTLTNHSYIDADFIGDDQSGNDSVVCHTNLSTCCNGSHGGGHWYFPDGLEVSSDDDSNVYVNRVAVGIRLQRRGDNIPSGVYRCNIPIATPNQDNATESLYVGIYNGNKGDVTTSGNIVVSLHADMAQIIYYFTLTCVSTGGPATNITWMRDSSIVITQGTKSVLNDPVTSRYTHTLVGSIAGVYSCLVVNNKPSSSMATATVVAASPPFNVTAIQDGPTSISINWISTSHSEDTTGYLIVYKEEGTNNNGTVFVSSESDHLHLANLQSGSLYTILMVGVSDGLSSSPVQAGPLALAPFFAPILGKRSVTATEILIAIHLLQIDSFVTGFIVEWQRNTSVGCSDLNSSTIHVDGVFDEYNITGLEPGNQYSVRVRATNEAGSGPASTNIISTTQEEAPTGPPVSLRQSFVTPNNISVVWDEVECLDRNGEIIGYRVYVLESGHITRNQSYAEAHRKANFTDLTHSTQYIVQVAAYNRVGVGPVSEINVTTKGKISLLAVTSNTSIVLFWILEQTLTAIDYSISYYDTNRNCFTTIRSIPGNETGFIIQDLEVATSYSVTVTANFLEGRGQGEDNITIATPDSTPSSPPLFVSVRTKSSTSEIELQWGPINCHHRNGEIVGYSIMYQENGSHEINESVPGNPTTGGKYTISGLKEEILYIVQVAGMTREGIGPYSTSKVVMTHKDVFLTLNGVIIPNHGYVDINEIGFCSDTALLCHTSKNPSTYGRHSGGDWYSPDGTRVNKYDVPGVTRNRGPMVVRLFRRTHAHNATRDGFYYCIIENKNLNFRKVFVFLDYNKDNGNITVEMKQPILVEGGENPVFTLTCISYGGPATTVTWTRDTLTNITERHITLFNETSHVYNHSLNTSVAGQYTCTVGNNVFSTSLTTTLIGVEKPTAVKVVQNGISSISVSWNASNAARYNVMISSNTEDMREISVKGTETNLVLRDLVNGLKYTISIIGKSLDLPQSLPTVLQVTLVPLPPKPYILKDRIFTAEKIIFLTWTASPYVTSYVVSWSIQGLRPTIDGTSGRIMNNSYTIVGLKSDTTYTITVTAFNQAGNSSTIFSYSTAKGTIIYNCEMSNVTETCYVMRPVSEVALIAALVAIILVSLSAIVILLAIIAVLIKSRSKISMNTLMRKETEGSGISDLPKASDDGGINTSSNKAYKTVSESGEDGGTLRHSTYVVADSQNDDPLYANI